MLDNFQRFSQSSTGLSLRNMLEPLIIDKESNNGHKIATRCKITDRQLSKLKFLAYSVLKGKASDLEEPGELYSLLERHCNDSERATKMLCLMLRAVGARGSISSLPQSTPERDVFDSDEQYEKYKWRKKLLACADNCREQKTLQRKLQETFDFESSISTDPVEMFECMIRKDILIVGELECLEKVEKTTKNYRNKQNCTKFLLVLTIILLPLLLLALLLPITRFTPITNLSHNQSVYFTENVTFLLDKSFDTQFYKAVSTRITSNSSAEINYNVLLCQATCTDDNEIIRVHSINFTGTVGAGYDNKSFVKFPETTLYPISASFMLEGSELTMSFIKDKGNITASAEIYVSIFTNVINCRDYDNGNDRSPQIKQKVTQVEGFQYNYTAMTNDYVCIVVEVPQDTVFNYTVHATLRQYYNLTQLQNEGVCVANTSLKFNTTTPAMEKFSLLRPYLKVTGRPTCVLITVTGTEYSIFSISSVVYGTSANIGVFALTISAAILFIIGCTMITMFSCMCLC